MNYLWEHPEARFTHAEIWFFKMWWYEQTYETQTRFRKLVDEGRWEFVNGGWVASDEACPIYEDLLLNLVVGHAWLKENLNVVPKFGWHVDAFGHSNVMNYIF